MGPAGHGVVTLRCGAKDAQARGSQRVLVAGTRRRRASAEAGQGNWQELTLTMNYVACENLATLLGGWLRSPHFRGRETEARRGYAICPQSQQAEKPQFGSRAA